MREEFSTKVKLQAWERAQGCCEGENCPRNGRKLYTGDIFYDHRTADAVGGSALLDNCQVLCRSCHSSKTYNEDIPVIAKGKRVRRKHIGIKPARKFAGWRRFDGTIVWNK